MSLDDIRHRFGDRVRLGAPVLYRGREASIQGAAGEYLRLRIIGEDDVETADPAEVTFLRAGDFGPDDFITPDGSGDDSD